MGKLIQNNICDQYIQDAAVYSLYVNRMRSLPDVRDGLKPVQRRIIWSAYNNTKCVNDFKKSARLQGDVMGAYHPHGDAAIYGAMKPIANWFETYKPLLVGQGNWGNFQGDPQSAARYTEVKLSQFAIDCVLGSIKDIKEVVDWNATYDDKNVEPAYLPIEVPLLLINGSFGIGYGISVNIPKHNINEVIDATIHHIQHPNTKVVLIPDTCMECEIVEADFESISNLGYGKYIVRGIIDIERRKNKDVLIIRSVPDLTYLNSANGIVDKIEKMVTNKQLPQIHDMVDKSIIDKDGTNGNKDIMQYEIELKAGADANYVRDMIYNNTPMQSTVSVNMEVVHQYNPIRMSYTSYIDIFLDMRKATKIRYYYNKLSKVNTKYHEIDAYVKLLSSGKIDEILNMIRKNKKDDQNLINYLCKSLNITEMQAQYIINVNIKKLSPYYLKDYQEKMKQLETERDLYITKIRDEDIILKEIIQELREYKKKYGEPRHSKVVPKGTENNIPQGKFKLILTEKGFIKKLPVESKSMGSFRDDKPIMVIEGDNNENILLFTKEGKVFKLPIHKIPISDGHGNGTNIQLISNKIFGNIITMVYEPAILELSKNSNRYYICVVTNTGFIKRMDLDDFLNTPPSGIIYNKLNGDYVVQVALVGRTSELVLWNNTNKALHLGINKDIPHLKRSTHGNITFSNTDGVQNFVRGMNVIRSKDTDLLVVTNSGKINRLSIAALPCGKRNTNGKNVIKLGKGDYIEAILSVSDNDSIYIKTDKNKYTIEVKDIEFGSSVSSGNKVIPKSENIIECRVL